MKDLIVLNNPDLKSKDTDYCNIQDTLMQYYLDGQYEEGLQRSLEIVDEFPNKATSNYRWSILFYQALGDQEALFAKLEEGFRKGAWWSEKALREDYWPLINSPSIDQLFSKIIEISAKNEKERNDENNPQLLVKLPPNYNNKKQYPLLLVIHGRYSSNTNTHPRWSTILEKVEIVVAFLQSSQKQTKEHFVWDDEDIAFKDLKSAYSYLMLNYSIDPAKIILAGTSQGAGLAFNAVFSDVVAASGLVGVIPAGIKPSIKDCFREGSNIYTAIKCSIIAGEKDPRFANTLKIKEFLNLNGVNTELQSFNEGHTYPPNLSELLLKSIKFILYSN